MTALTPELTAAMRRIDGLLKSGDFQGARAALEAILADNPQFVEAQRLLAGTRQALGDLAAAEELLRRALALEPAWPPTLASLGELLLGNGRGSEAEPLLKRAAGASPPYPHAALLLARYYNGTGRPAEALAAAAPLCLGGHADAELSAQHIAALGTLGRAPEAVAVYRRVTAAVPANRAAAHALAVALNATGQHEEAAHVASRLLTRGYRTAALYDTYARSLIAQGARDRAEEALRECLQLEPRRVEAHSNLAQLIWLRTGEVTAATAELDRALETFPGDETLWAAKAALLQGAGDARAAYDCLAPWAARREAQPALLLRAGLAALEFAPEDARILAERALTLVPENAAARTVLAAALLGIGDARAALGHCERLLSRDPDDQYLIALETTAWRLLGDERYAQLCDYAKLVMPFELEAPRPWRDMETFLAELRVSLNHLHDPRGHALLFQSLRHGTETTQDLSRSSDAAIRGLFGAFVEPINRYLERIGQGTDPLRRRNHGRWRFNGAWSVRLRSAGYHAIHTHPRGWISSACYLELPDSMRDEGSEAGILTFGEPGVRTSPALGSEFSVRPRVGMLVLFPSYFWHGTVPFHGSQPRLTVAFDAVPES